MAIAQSYPRKKGLVSMFSIQRLMDRTFASSVGGSFEGEGKLLERKGTKIFWLNWLYTGKYMTISIVNWLIFISALKNHSVTTHSTALKNTAGLKQISLLGYLFFLSILKVFERLNQWAGSLDLGTLGIKSSILDTLFQHYLKLGHRT